MDALMTVSAFPYIAIRFQLVSKDGGLRHDVFFDKRHQGIRVHTLSRLSDHAPATFNRADNGNFADHAAPMNLSLAHIFVHVLSLAAYIRFVNFYLAGKRLAILIREHRANLFEHAPCRFVCHSKFALKLLGRDAATGRGHKIDGIKPEAQRRRRFVIDGVCGRVNVMPAMSARLVLADGIAYAKQLGASRIVDLATLTGSIIIALGDHRTGLFSNDDEWANRIKQSAERAGEPVWRMPVSDDYKKPIESAIADFKNYGGRPDATAAALLLSKFAGETPWVHLDIAGTSWHDQTRAYAPKGSTGAGVQTLVELVCGEA